jgi:UTP--glucose-1-phosphate uridylyltransferase
VDNLAATLDPVMIGYHASHRAEMTLEVTERKAPDGTLDEGGAPVRLHGRLVLKEKVTSADHALLSTNNFTFELRPLLDKSIDLPWRVVRKKALGKDVLQFETVSGEASGLLDERGRPVLKTEFIRVPREDPADSRFEPIKVPEHLPRAVQRMQQRLEALADAMAQ